MGAYRRSILSGLAIFGIYLLYMNALFIDDPVVIHFLGTLIEPLFPFHEPVVLVCEHYFLCFTNYQSGFYIWYKIPINNLSSVKNCAVPVTLIFEKGIKGILLHVSSSTHKCQCFVYIHDPVVSYFRHAVFEPLFPFLWASATGFQALFLYASQIINLGPYTWCTVPINNLSSVKKLC